MKLLVTGCNGYIGSHAVRVLKQQGHHCTGWDIDVHDDHNNVSSYLDRFECQDIRDATLQGSYDAVIHLAGLARVEESMHRPYDYYHTNIVGTHHMVSNVDTDHILFASTSSAWAMASPYARSKVAAEDVIKASDKPHTIFRFFNVSGTDGVHRQLGPATHLIRVAAEVAAGKRDHIKIYGNDYATRDGTCVRDYVHVLDLVEALAAAVARGAANTEYECIGSNQGFTVLEVLAAMRAVTGHAIPAQQAPRRAGDAESSVVDQLSDLVTLKRDLATMCEDQYRLECQR